MKLSIATVKDYITEQISIHEAIKASFPHLSIDDHHICHGLFCIVRDTLAVLYDLRSEVCDADSYDDFKAVMDDMLCDYRKDLEDAQRWAASQDALGAITANIQVTAAQTPVTVIGSIMANLDAMENRDLLD